MRTESFKFQILRTPTERRLQVSAPKVEDLSSFQGLLASNVEGITLSCPLSTENARALRTHLPVLVPRPLGTRLSAGVGDRLGLATSGHASAFRRYGTGVVPVFAQQSMREMVRLGRSPQEVIDATTFGLLEASWTDVHGSDADHLKTTSDIDQCLEAGFTLFTLDPGEHVNPIEGSADGNLNSIPWGSLFDDEKSFLKRYSQGLVDVDGTTIRFTEMDLRIAALKYSNAIIHAFSMYQHLVNRAMYPVEVEIAIDETDYVTTFFEHYYLANEMKRLGMSWVSFAPRYIDGFEKGVEFKGSLGELQENLEGHAAIARSVGPYKLSLHSGSDKFQIYELAKDVTDGLLHLKTSGTSYLEALHIVSQCDPELFRELYEISRTAYRESKSTYQVSSKYEDIPSSKMICDSDLTDLVLQPVTRQMLHVGYGAVLTNQNLFGTQTLKSQIYNLLNREFLRYDESLEEHIGKHLAPLSRK